MTPWRAVQYKYCERPGIDSMIETLDGKHIADAYGTKKIARLIAAAPELYAACEAVEAAQRGGDYAVAFAAVRAALAKVSP